LSHFEFEFLVHAQFLLINVLTVTPPTPPTQPPPPTDVNFLPSCTVSQAVNAVFRCERIFARPNIFLGPHTCRYVLWLFLIYCLMFVILTLSLFR